MRAITRQGWIAIFAIASLWPAAPVLAILPPAEQLPDWCKSPAPLSAEHAKIASEKGISDYHVQNSAIKGPLFGGKMGCAQTLNENATSIALVKAEDFNISGVPARAIYQRDVVIAFGPGETPRQTDFLPYWGNFMCFIGDATPKVGNCLTGIDKAGDLSVGAMADRQEAMAAMVIDQDILPRLEKPVDFRKPVRVANGAGAMAEAPWENSRDGLNPHFRAQLSGNALHDVINGLREGRQMTISVALQGSEERFSMAIDEIIVQRQFNAAFALARQYAEN